MPRILSLDVCGMLKLNTENEVVFARGKNKNKTFSWVVCYDLGYVEWCLSNVAMFKDVLRSRYPLLLEEVVKEQKSLAYKRTFSYSRKYYNHNRMELDELAEIGYEPQY